MTSNAGNILEPIFLFEEQNLALDVSIFQTGNNIVTQTINTADRGELSQPQHFTMQRLADLDDCRSRGPADNTNLLFRQEGFFESETLSFGDGTFPNGQSIQIHSGKELATHVRIK